VLSWTSQRGYVRDGVEPEIGETSAPFDFRILFSDLDGDEPAEGTPRVHIRRGKTDIKGSPFSMTPMNEKPTWQGRPYQVEVQLAPGEDYSYHFTASDSQGNEAPRSLTRRSPTVDAAADIAAPSLANVRVTDRGPRSVAIRWETDEQATAEVAFGTDATYGKRSGRETPADSHRIELKGLAPDTTYHFRVSSTDAAGNRATSGDYTFETDHE